MKIWLIHIGFLFCLTIVLVHTAIGNKIDSGSIMIHKPADILMLKQPFVSDTATSLFSFPFVGGDSTTNAVNPTQYQPQYDSLPYLPIDLATTAFGSQKTTVEFAELRPLLPEKWLFYIVLFLSSIIVFVKSFFTRYFNELWRSFFNMNSAMQMMRQQEIAFSVPGILLSLNFFVALASIIFLNIYHQKTTITVSEFGLILSLVGVIVAFVFFRFFIYQISIGLFNRKSELQTISFLDLLQLEFVGIILTPTLLILAFGSGLIGNIAWIFCYAFLGGFLLYRIYSGWRVAGHVMFNNLFHFILYICTVEIAPVLIIIRLTQQWTFLKH